MLVPIQCEYYALEGLSQLLATIDLVRDNLNPELRLAGVLLTMYDARTTLSSDVAAKCAATSASASSTTVIPRSVRLAEAPSHGRPIVALQPGVARRAGLPRRWPPEVLARGQAPRQRSTGASAVSAR